MGLACHHFDAGRCRSCSWLDRSYDDQLAAKVDRCRAVFAPWPEVRWDPPVRSAREGFRNKAKMVVGGTSAAPTLGILDEHGAGVDLRDCPLHEPALVEALPALSDLVGRAAIAPYDVRSRRGELKHLLVTASPDGALLVRFVLRSQEAVSRLRKHVGGLLAALPQVAVLSVNVQPAPSAVLEGDLEIVLHGETLPMRVNGHVLHLRPASFFQTNTAVAAELYRTAVEWTGGGPADAAVRTVLDLYCGVGGFALHLSGPGRDVLGVEISAEAVESARRSAAEAGGGARFLASDATRALESEVAADLVVVNPPRRGIGADLAQRLERSATGTVLYSSCNPATLGQDLALMPSLVPVRARVLDMFPHTGHLEVLTLLRRR